MKGEQFVGQCSFSMTTPYIQGKNKSYPLINYHLTAVRTLLLTFMGVSMMEEV